MNLYQIPLSERLTWVWRFTVLCHSGQYPFDMLLDPLRSRQHVALFEGLGKITRELSLFPLFYVTN